MRIYLAGPMRGIKDFNFPAFMEAAEKLRTAGHMVFNPAERDQKEHGADIGKSETGNLDEANAKGFNHRQAMADDCNFIALHADAIAMLPGWQNSKGATAERALAECLGLTVIELGQN